MINHQRSWGDHMKKIILLLTLMLLISSVFVMAKKESELEFGAVRSSFIENDLFEVHYNVLNYGEGDSENGAFWLWIPELNYVYFEKGPDFDEDPIINSSLTTTRQSCILK